MKQKHWTIALCCVLGGLLVIIVLTMFNLLFAYLVRQENPWADFPVTPTSYGSEWYSEDGNLNFSTFEKYDSYEQTFANGHVVTVPSGDITKGFLAVGEKTIPIYIGIDYDGTMGILLDDKPYLPTETYEEIETWKVVDYESTDTNVILVFKVVETTYFEKGQVIKLICSR